MKTVRLFIACTIPQTTQKIIAESLHTYLGSREGIRAIPSHDYHITVKFLGDTNLTTIPTCVKVLEEVALQHESYECRADHLLLLPPRDPRVIALGIAPHQDMNRLHGDIDQALSEQGIGKPEHRRYKPHLSIARIQYKNSDRELLPNTFPGIPFTFPLTSITLFESTLRPQGPIYTPLVTCPLS